MYPWIVEVLAIPVGEHMRSSAGGRVRIGSDGGQYDRVLRFEVVAGLKGQRFTKRCKVDLDAPRNPEKPFDSHG